MNNYSFNINEKSIPIDDDNKSTSLQLKEFIELPIPDLNLPNIDTILVKSGSYEPFHNFRNVDFDKQFDEILLLIDIKEKKKQIELLAKKDHSPSNAWIGESYLYGKNDYKISISKAKKYLKDANNLRHPKATYDLYQLYNQNNEIRKSFEYLEEAVSLGYEDSIKQLAECCYCGENQSRAMYIFKIGIVLGIENSFYSLLAEPYYYGISIAKDYEYAYQLFYHAAVRMNESQSYFHLSQCYYNGNGVEQDFKLTIHWLTKSHSLDFDGETTNAFGLLYLRGHGVQQDLKNALSLFELALKNGYPNDQAQLNIKCAKQCLHSIQDSNIVHELIKQHYLQEKKWSETYLQPASLRNKAHFGVPNYYRPPTPDSLLARVIIGALDGVNSVNTNLYLY